MKGLTAKEEEIMGFFWEKGKPSLLVRKRAGFVNENRVHFVNNGVGQRTLTTVADFILHIVAQVVEAEFVVGTERDVCQICLAACVGVRLVTVDAIYAQTVEHIKRTHPFGVTFCQIVVHCYHVHAVTVRALRNTGRVATMSYLHRLPFRQSYLYVEPHRRIAVHHNVPCSIQYRCHLLSNGSGRWLYRLRCVQSL